MSDQMSNRSNLYLHRNSAWCWSDDGLIELCSAEGTIIRKLDDWETLIFNSADGSNTLAQVAQSLSETHPAETDTDYLAKLAPALDRLSGIEQAVQLKPKKEDLPEHFDLPGSRADDAE